MNIFCNKHKSFGLFLRLYDNDDVTLRHCLFLIMTVSPYRLHLRQLVRYHYHSGIEIDNLVNCFINEHFMRYTSKSIKNSKQTLKLH